MFVLVKLPLECCRYNSIAHQTHIYLKLIGESIVLLFAQMMNALFFACILSSSKEITGTFAYGMKLSLLSPKTTFLTR